MEDTEHADLQWRIVWQKCFEKFMDLFLYNLTCVSEGTTNFTEPPFKPAGGEVDCRWSTPLILFYGIFGFYCSFMTL